MFYYNIFLDTRYDKSINYTKLYYNEKSKKYYVKSENNSKNQKMFLVKNINQNIINFINEIDLYNVKISRAGRVNGQGVHIQMSSIKEENIVKRVIDRKPIYSRNMLELYLSYKYGTYSSFERIKKFVNLINKPTKYKSKNYEIEMANRMKEIENNKSIFNYYDNKYIPLTSKEYGKVFYNNETKEFIFNPEKSLLRPSGGLILQPNKLFNLDFFIKYIENSESSGKQEELSSFSPKISEDYRIFTKSTLIITDISGNIDISVNEEIMGNVKKIIVISRDQFLKYISKMQSYSWNPNVFCRETFDKKAEFNIMYFRWERIIFHLPNLLKYISDLSYNKIWIVSNFLDNDSKKLDMLISAIFPDIKKFGTNIHKNIKIQNFLLKNKLVISNSINSIIGNFNNISITNTIRTITLSPEERESYNNLDSEPKMRAFCSIGDCIKNYIYRYKSYKANNEYTKTVKEIIDLDKKIDCPICYETFNKTELVYLNCNHIYCVNCVKRIYETNRKCPTCRRQFTKNLICRLSRNTYLPTKIADILQYIYI